MFQRCFGICSKSDKNLMDVDIYEILKSDDSDQLQNLLESGTDPNSTFDSVPETIFGNSPFPFLYVASGFDNPPFSCISTLLEAGAHPDLTDGQGNTPLMAAAQKGSIQVAELLINAEADLTKVNQMNLHTIHIAAQFGKIEFLEYILNLDPSIDINMLSFDNETPLMLACRNGYKDIVPFLISKGADINFQDSYGNTACHIAIQNGSIDSAFSILETGLFRINTTNLMQRTILHEAALTGNVELFQKILELHAIPTILDCQGNTIVHLAAISGNYFMLDFILHQSMIPVDPDKLNKEKYAPLHYACAYGPVESVSDILELSSKRLNDYECNYSPLYFAIKHNHLDIVELLINHPQFDATPVFPGYLTPAHIACRLPRTDILQALIHTHLFDLTIPDSIGWSPIHYAASKSSLEAIQILVEAGVDLETRTNDNETVFHILKRRGSRNIFQYLETIIPAPDE